MRSSFFPGSAAKIGAPDLEKFIQEGIAKAGGYGIDEHGGVAQFLNLQFAFGPEFDHTCSWASEILGNFSTLHLYVVEDDAQDRLLRFYSRQARVIVESVAINAGPAGVVA